VSRWRHLWALPLAITLAAGGLVSPAAAQGPAAPCAACVAVIVDPASGGAIPEGLAGLVVLVRLVPGGEPQAAAMLDAIRARGGRPGLLIEARAAPEDLLREADIVVLAVAADPPPGPARIYDVKTRLTALRAALHAHARLGLRAASATAGELLAHGVAPYVDFVISPARPEASVGWWRDAGVLADVSAAARGIRDEERAVWEAPADAAALSRALRLAQAPPDRFALSVDVPGLATLGVEEIIARHQGAAARQHAAIRTRVSSGTMSLTFEAPAFSAPVTVAADVVMYVAGGRTDLEHRSIRVNGLQVGDDVPKLPLIEPDRVASPPLAIELTDVYRYSLEGTEVVDGTAAYVVAFEPVVPRRTLFKGRAWIARDSFALVRVSAAQTNLRGAIVASEQTDEFAPDGSGFWLLRRSQVHQRYEGAGHRTPIERVLTLDRHDINPGDFDARRRAAFASSSVILRDTPHGYRYLRDPDEEAERAGESEQRGERTIQPLANRVRSIVFGAMVDPNISRPLPFAGLSYVDFDLLGTGAQLNAFFGGTFGQVAFLLPSVAGTRWQVGGRAFAIATRFNDRAFADGRERYDENILQRPARGAVWLVRPLTPRISVRAGYDVEYTSFARAATTADAFVVPASQLVHAFRAAIDAQRGGWAATAWWSPAVRTGWRFWGTAGRPDYDPRQRNFQRYGLALSRSAVVRPDLVVRGEVAWMGGRDLDRFSRYSFGAFDNRLRGYPAALIRYDRGAVVRGAAAWAVSPLLRVTGFADSAVVHDPGFGAGVRRFTGIGTAVEVPAPFGTLLAGEWGYGLQGRRSDGSRGTHVFRVTAFKAF